MSKNNLGTRKVIAIAGAGDLGRYICEEILKSLDFVPIILSRGVGSPKCLRHALSRISSSQLINCPLTHARN